MKRQPDIIQAIRNKKLFGSLPEFRDLSTWFAWITWLKSLYGLPLDESELLLFQNCTGRIHPPFREPKESATIVGRRGGKSKMAALVGAFTAAFIDFRPYLSTGERPMVLILPRDKEQAKVVLGYLTVILQSRRWRRRSSRRAATSWSWTTGSLFASRRWTAERSAASRSFARFATR
jgi:hypothetical protein